jgi:hypothetical protein
MFHLRIVAARFVKNNCGHETVEKVFQPILTLDFHFCHRFLHARRMKVPQRSPLLSCVGAVPQPPLAFAPEPRRSHCCPAPQPVPHPPHASVRHPRWSRTEAVTSPTARPYVRATPLPWPSAIGRERERAIGLDNEQRERELKRK